MDNDSALGALQLSSFTVMSQCIVSDGCSTASGQVALMNEAHTDQV